MRELACTAFMLLLGLLVGVHCVGQPRKSGEVLFEKHVRCDTLVSERVIRLMTIQALVYRLLLRTWTPMDCRISWFLIKRVCFLPGKWRVSRL